VENFLVGAEGHDWIDRKKLSDEDRESLEGEINYEELEKAMKTSNIKRLVI